MTKRTAWLWGAMLMLPICFLPRAASAQVASEPLKPYVVLVLDTSGSMVSGGGSVTGSGPPSCGGIDNRLNHAKCAINNIVNSYGDMVFALGRFREGTSTGTLATNITGNGGTACDPDGNGQNPGMGGAGCKINNTVCTGADNAFELLTPLLDGANENAANLTDFQCGTCGVPAAGTAPGSTYEIWGAEASTPLGGSLRGANRYWGGLQATDGTTIWPSGTAGFDPIRSDVRANAFLAPAGSPTCDPNPMTCGGAMPCCESQCRPYITIMLTDGDENCSGNASAAAAAALTTPLTLTCPGGTCTAGACVGGTRAGLGCGPRQYRIETKVIAMGQPDGYAPIEAIAHAGGAVDDGNPATSEGYYASDEASLQLAISEILDDAIRTEVCNNKDDDCDGNTDEGFTGVTAGCNNNKFGACRVNGTGACRADGQGVECSAGVAPCASKSLGASCNVVNAAGATVAGTCQAGNPQLVCMPTPAPGANPADPTDNEVGFGCDNIDNDCDGFVDEHVPGCTCNVMPEICDGVNNDCDGATDENTAVPCNNGTCPGIRPCNGSAGLGACTAQVPDPLGEHICDGLDDNCDGNKDGFTEDCSNMFCPGGACTGGPAGERTCVGGTRAGKRCDTNPDYDERNNPAGVAGSACALEGAACACKTGVRTCPLNGAGVYTACVQEIEPSVEICNNIDDDCDGKIDETPMTACNVDSDCPPITPDCDTTAHTCQPADCSVNSCGGQLLCVNGAPMCTQTSGVDDTCNNVDEDCDMKVDEGWKCADPDGADNILGNADDCGCNVAGQCNAHQSCQNGSVICMGDPVGQETCNCQDDDCDGHVDENAASLCGAGATCDESACQCAFPCAQGEFPCPTGKLCNANHFCVADPCFNVTCPQVADDLQVCRPKPSNPADHECISACDPTVMTCPTTTVCFKPTGDCRPDDCTTFPEYCTAAQSCVNGTCVSNPCTGVTCDAGQFCNNGTCYGSCAGVECPTGQRCQLGTCQDDPCGKQCPFGKACDPESGTCVTNPCDAFQCPQGQWCDPEQGSMCVDDPCTIFNITCEEGQVCRGGGCYDADAFKPDAGVETHVTTGGGGGCSTSGDANGTFVLGLGLAMALTLRRRKRLAGVVSVGLLVAATTLLGCDVNEYCLNCETGDGGHIGGDDGAADDDSGGGSADDGGMVDDSGDGGQCVPTGAEVCDDKDNDCNGQVDEGTLPTIGDPCDSQVGECANGHKICKNGGVVCSTQGPEVCDNKDNNCDGTADEGDPGGGAVCGTNTGECVAGVNRCVTGTIQCVGAVGPAPESCNNRDDDCDGLFDENLTLGPCVAGVDGPTQANTGECALGTRQCVGGVTKCVGAVFPTFELCDTGNLDSDCDGAPSNGYNLNTDPQNCGTCGTKCDLPHAFENCGGGTCGIAACETNFFDNNHMAGDGCEFNCGHALLGPEICNGIDDDCDGLVDGADPDMQTPNGLCDTDGACSTGTALSCDAALGWRCHYNNPNVQTSDGAHTQITPETICDSDINGNVQSDNDCDGRVDEAQPNLAQACDNGMQGDCRDSGSYVCDTVRTNPATCKYTTLGAGMSPETCDGHDNNCNGQVDEGAATGTLAGIGWSVIPNTTPAVQIMKYEASRPDANPAALGTITDHVCSRETVQPWTNITQPEAETACETIGARLCSEAEWQTMCLPTTTYPVAAPTTTDAQTFTFIEAEDYFVPKNDIGGHPWTRIAPADLDGITAMQVPDSGFAQNTAASALAQSSRLDYRLNVTATGNYYVWLHMQSPTPSSSPNVFGTHTAPAVTLAPVSNATTAIGDIVIVTTWTTSTAAVTHTLQGGFTAINSQAYDEGGNHARLSVAYKVATAAGAQTYQAYAASGGTTTSYSAVTIVRAGTVNIASLVSAVTSSNNNSDNNGKLDPPGPTNPAVPSLVLAIGAYAGGQGTITAPNGFSEQWQMTNGTSTNADLALDSRTATTTGQTNPGTFTAGFNRTGAAAMTISIPMSVSGNSNSLWVGMTAGTTAGQASNTAVTTTDNEQWEWRVSPAFNVTATGTQTFSIYLKDDGAIVDSLAVARQNTTGPTFDNVWAYQNNPRTSQPGVCNNDGYDTSAAAGDQDDILPTATLPMCFANHADISAAGDTDAYDMSGNVKEWTAARTAGQNPIRGGSSNNEENGTACKSNFTLAPDTFFFPNVGFRCCRLKP